MRASHSLSPRLLVPRPPASASPGASRAPALALARPGGRDRGRGRDHTAAPRLRALHRAHDREARSPGPGPRAEDDPAPAVAPRPAEALLDAGDPARRTAKIPAGGGRARVVGRRLRGIRGAPRLSGRRSDAPYPLEELGPRGPARRQGVPGRILRAPRPGARYVHRARR